MLRLVPKYIPRRISACQSELVRLRRWCHFGRSLSSSSDRAWRLHHRRGLSRPPLAPAAPPAEPGQLPSERRSCTFGAGKHPKPPSAVDLSRVRAADIDGPGDLSVTIRLGPRFAGSNQAQSSAKLRRPNTADQPRTYRPSALISRRHRLRH